ncbi:hypothetical protein KFE25_001477 [Diacronema lutheri]|uniref:Major facilitator superfamily (MFS) profile domain-containing protein n=2 Tax=Diacronema lutheri TaxID=2081491 RepID=A0A8J5X0J5_DIALT|nr:hypothetical protein KFE25_001477 [Diacronema lutheri]
MDVHDALLHPRRPRALALGLPYDALLAFALKGLRMLSYGAIAPVFFAYCVEAGLSEQMVGVLVSAILLGDLAVTLLLTTRADRFGRRWTLVLGSLLKLAAGVAFASATSFRPTLGTPGTYAVLVVAGIVGVISTSGAEIGPFIAIEQACLTEAVTCAEPDDADPTAASARMATLFGAYNALGFVAQACGTFFSGELVQRLHDGWAQLPLLDAHRVIFAIYGLIGALMALLYMTMTSAVEPRASMRRAGAKASAAAAPQGRFLGLRRPESKFIVARLSALFAMDAFAGGFVMQSWVAFWLTRRWGLAASSVGRWLSAANLVAGLSGIAAGFFVKRFGAMLTMVATHLPSNVLLALVPLMPTGASAGAMLVGRFTISQMDVPARQAYVAMVVAPDERSAAGGITNLVRSLGVAASPLLLGYLSSFPPTSAPFSAPFVIAAAVKIAYDVALYGLYVCGTGLRANEASAALHNAHERTGEMTR